MISVQTFMKTLTVFLFFPTTFAIDGDSAEESPCFNITSAVDPDETWFSSVTKWYYPLASRLDLYRSVHDLLETDYKNIPEYSVYYDSCLEWTIDSKGFTLYGYNGKTRHLNAEAVAQGTSNFQSEWSQGMMGTAYTTLTDNKTFMFTAACFSDNQMSWNVFATTPTLNDETKKQIFDHAKSLGYNPYYFTEMNYAPCNAKDNGDGGSSTTLSPPSCTTSAATQPSPSTSTYSPTTSTSKPGGGTFICNACKKMCPNLTDRNPLYRYYKKLYSAKNRRNEKIF